MTTSSTPPFVRKAFFDQPELIGARWWHESMALAMSRRKMLTNLAWFGGSVAVVGGGGFALWKLFEEKTITDDAIEIQRLRGWNLGNGTVTVPFGQSTDARGEAGWSGYFDRLAHELGPHVEALRPWYVPTLFQSLAEPENQSLASVMKPMRSPDMDVAEACGRSVASLFNPHDARRTALVVDIPGPEAVAFAAGAGKLFDPVFVFDNWPHPSGVVPSHHTLAATLYYFSTFRDQSPDRTSDAPAMFVLDSARLTPYHDAVGQFDNRYVARLPSAPALAGLGVQHVLYVAPDAKATEQDDLNDDFIALKAAGIDVKTVALTDFVRHGNTPDYFYGGTPETHAYFWHHYGWYPAPIVPFVVPVGVSPGHSYTPAPRRTIFSGAGPTKTKPGGFGRVSIAAPPDYEPRPAVGGGGGGGSGTGSGTDTGSRSGSGGSWGRGGGSGGG